MCVSRLCLNHLNLTLRLYLPALGTPNTTGGVFGSSSPHTPVGETPLATPTNGTGVPVSGPVSVPVSVSISSPALRSRGLSDGGEPPLRAQLTATPSATELRDATPVQQVCLYGLGFVAIV